MMEYIDRLSETECPDPKLRERLNLVINQLNLLTRIWEGCHNGVSGGITDRAIKAEKDREVKSNG